VQFAPVSVLAIVKTSVSISEVVHFAARGSMKRSPCSTAATFCGSQFFLRVIVGAFTGLRSDRPAPTPGECADAFAALAATTPEPANRPPHHGPTPVRQIAKTNCQHNRIIAVSFTERAQAQRGGIGPNLVATDFTSY
jgi:hypothetical protein